jgi:class 3 adenylate cyclase
MNPKTISAQYIFTDIVGYSNNRSIEAQTDILESLNDVVRSALEIHKITRRRYIPVPTGDGMCIALLAIQEPFDIALTLAIQILHSVTTFTEKQEDPMRKYKIRIGLNENTDNLVQDVTGRRNLAGAGITYAQRIMDLGDASHILVGRSLYDRLSQRERYRKFFKHYKATLKHAEQLDIYQYIEEERYYLNNDIPTLFVKRSNTKRELTILMAFYLALLKKYQSQIRTLVDEPVDTYALQLLLIYLSKDFLSSYQRSEFTPEDYLMFREQISDKDVDFTQAFSRIKQNHFSLIIDLAEFYIRELISKKHITDLFEEGTYYLCPSDLGMTELKNRFPKVLSYFEIPT